MNKLGVIVRDLDRSQSNFFLLQTLNQLNQEMNIDCCVFYENSSIPIIPILFSTFHINEVYDFTGTVISTYMLGTKRLLGSPGPKKKFFYIWNLEWNKIPQFAYNNIRDIYLNPDMNLIARSDHHAKLIGGCFKKPHCVFDNWDKNEIEKLCNIT